MMKRLVSVFMWLACVILAAVTVLIFVSADRTAPLIFFPNEDTVYTLGEDTDSLLEGVTARDEKDGDVTDSLVIERIHQEGDKVFVTYVARDKNNNISKAQREVSCGEVKSAGTEPENADNADNADEGSEPEESETASAEEPTEEPQTEPQAAVPGGPVITLTQYELTIAVGEQINPLLYVADITDDKDDRESLWRNIQISGNFDPNTPGVYTQVFYLYDSDRNRSNEAVLTITVQ